MKLNGFLPVTLLILLAVDASSQKAVPRATPVPSNPRWESEACRWPRRLFGVGGEFGYLGFGKYTRNDALKQRQELSDPRWKELLPCCPETFADTKESTLWEEDSTFLECFHPEAVRSVRTSKWFHRLTSSGPGQQCTYNASGKLIPSGPGAGSPDYVSPNSVGGGKEGHWKIDLFAWTKLSPAEYDTSWTPNPGCNSRITYGLQPDHWTNIWMFVRAGDVISFIGSGRVRFDVEGNITGPEGSLVTPKTDIGLIGRLIAPTPLPTAAPGALIGAICEEEIETQASCLQLSEPFLIGKSTVVIIKRDGYLLFGVNDGYLENNEGGFEVTVKREQRHR